MSRLVKRSTDDRRTVSDLSYFARGAPERRSYAERRTDAEAPVAERKNTPNLLDRAAWAGIVLLGIVATLLLVNILSS